MPDNARQIKFADLVLEGARPEFTSLRTVLMDVPGGRGFVFGLVEVQHREEDIRERFIHIVASHLEGLRADLAADGNVPRRFEAMLVKLNADLARVGGESKMSLRKIKSVIGVMTDAQVFMSGFGNAHVLFLHRTAERRYVVYELDQQLSNQEELSWEKPYLTVLDGELHPGDVFYIGTRIPPHALSLGDLQDILITLPPPGALERAQQFVPANSRYGAICFHVAEEEKAGPPKKANPIVSLVSFEETKHRTADLLGEQTPDIGGKLKVFADKLRKQLGNPGSRGAGSVLRRMLQLLIRGTVAMSLLLGKGAVALWHLLKNISATQEGKPGLLARTTVSMRQGLDKLKRTSIVAKGIAVGIFLLVFALGATVYASKSTREKAEAEVAYHTALERIEEKRVAAEASVIYNNTKDAQELIGQAMTLLAQLPRESKEQQETAQNLESSLVDLLAKTRGVELVSPTTITTSSTPLTGFVAVESDMYALDSTMAPYRVNELSKSLEAVDVGQNPLSGARIATAESGNILAVDASQRLGRATLTDAIKGVSPITSGINAMASVEDITMYNNSLYALTASAEQIVKMQPQGLGYEGGTPWLVASTEGMANATAIAVDGNVYVLSGNRILRFVRGRENTWDHAPIDPALTAPVDMWTSTDSLYLYILDADGRVIVLDKEKGHLVVQYTADSLKGAIGFIIRESENRIVISTSSTIVSFTATHLLK